MQIYQVVKYDSFRTNKWLMHKFPGDNFTSKSKLVVSPGQVAIIVHGGKVYKIFEAGTYTMDNANLPFLKDIISGVYNNKTPYSVDVYFFNQTIKLDMFFGTSAPIQLLDPKFNIMIRVRARGQYALRLRNYQFFLTNLLGSLPSNTFVTFSVLDKYLKGIINAKLKTFISQKMINDKVSILEITSHLEDMSNQLKENLFEDFKDFGIELINFYVESINSPEEDLDKLGDALNKKAEFDIMGENKYRTTRGYDVLEAAANNEGSGNIASAGIGLGLGIGAAKNVSEITNKSINANQDNIYCPDCGSPIQHNMKFCSSCGKKIQNTCPKCNAEIKPEQKFCSICGEKV